MSTEDRKRAAVNFLRLAWEGNRAAAEQLVASGARQHNPYFQAGMPALLDAITATAEASPTREVEVKRVLADGDYVVVQSHVHRDPVLLVRRLFISSGLMETVSRSSGT
jgi:predicted SnoaL-like aldol condensation-catalyzing enzyme